MRVQHSGRRATGRVRAVACPCRASGGRHSSSYFHLMLLDVRIVLPVPERCRKGKRGDECSRKLLVRRRRQGDGRARLWRGAHVAPYVARLDGVIRSVDPDHDDFRKFLEALFRGQARLFVEQGERLCPRSRMPDLARCTTYDIVKARNYRHWLSQQRDFYRLDHNGHAFSRDARRWDEYKAAGHGKEASQQRSPRRCRWPNYCRISSTVMPSRSACSRAR